MLQLLDLPSYEITFNSLELINYKELQNIPAVYMIYNKVLDEVIYVGYTSELKTQFFKKFKCKLNRLDDFLIYYVKTTESKPVLVDIKRELKDAYYKC